MSLHDQSSPVPAVRESPLLQRFYPALDGLRATAILLVFGWHFCRPVSNSAFFTWGWVGVNVFFVLSGFLITGILVDSLDRQRFFSTFYTRRTLRIFPLYYAVWLFFALSTPWLHVEWNRYVLGMAFYIGNLFKAGAGIAHADPGVLVFSVRPGHFHTVLIDHFWSLCVEEQFYLVWPLVVWWVRSSRRLLTICLVLITVTPIGRVLYQHLQHDPGKTFGVLYYHTLSRADALFLGAAVSLWLHSAEPGVRTVRRVAALAVVLAPALLLWLRLAEGDSRLVSALDPAVLTIGLTLINVASAGLLLLTIDTGTPLFRMLKARPLVLIGRVSYGLYIFNELLYNDLVRVVPHLRSAFERALFPAGSFVVTLACALVSFHLLEAPFLSLKKRLAPRAGAVEDPPASRPLFATISSEVR